MSITATYHAPSGDAEVVTTHGVRFFDGQAVELDPVEHKRLIGKLKGHKLFELTGADTIEEVSPPTLTARHKGRGVYAVVRGNETVVEGLSKADADAFNAMSENDKGEYVQVSLEEAS